MASSTSCYYSIFFVFFWCSSPLLVWTIVVPSCRAWIVTSSRPRTPQRRLPLSFSTIITSSRSSRASPLASSTTATNIGGGGSIIGDDDSSDDEGGDDVEYEYVEYDLLSEQDFAGSEWLVGTNWDSALNKIDETWVRLAVDEKSGGNIAIWGDKSQGKWSLDVASQFFSVSKENKLGISKQIWAGVVNDYYYLQGTVRGWTFWQAASVLAQWQAKRLGVDPQEAGTAPWFMVDDATAEDPATSSSSSSDDNNNDSDDDYNES
jgi:hypothetical protein